MDTPTIALGLGLFGASMNVVWPLFRSRTGMLLAQVGVSSSFGVHYWLLGAQTGAFMNALALAQALVAIPLGRREGFRIAYLVMLPIIAGALWWTWSGVASVFAGLGFALISLGRYQLAPIRFRVLLLAAVVPWVVHNALVGSIPGLIADTCAFGMGAVMLRRAIHEERTDAAGPVSSRPSTRRAGPAR